MYQYSQWLSRSVILIWVGNCLLASCIAVKEVWIPYMNAWWDSYQSIESDPFDGTTMPIAYIPDWTRSQNQDKSKRFEDIAISEYLPIPLYDALSLRDVTNSSKASTLMHYTYFTPYMGSYRLNYKENDGSHNAVDIRAPIGTPVLAIANGVIVRVNEADATGNKYIVIRHDGVPLSGGKRSLYSWYLHLSEILVTEWTKIRKGDMIWRVGMTGIATTPHLHIQIDTEEAPFHPYWPFSTSDSHAAWFWFYDSVNAGLGRDKALLYCIHPMNFINTYLWGNIGEIFSSAPLQKPQIPTSQSVDTAKEETIIASYLATSPESCSKKRYADVAEKSQFWKILYPLIDHKCLFQENNAIFGSKNTVTRKDAIITLMKYYGVEAANGTSHFLDIQIWDIFQWYSLIAYRRGILDGNYAYPERLITKWEFIDLLIKIARPEKNPSQIRVYSDVDGMNLYYQSAQDYALMTRTRWGKLNTSILMSRSSMVQILTWLSQKK